MKLPISAIILTYNEEKNIEACLESLKDFVEDIFIVDSFSNDKTIEIARRYTTKILQHEFENYGKQRNWALNNLGINTEWIINLDSDHRITEEFKQALINIFINGQDKNYQGFLISRKTIFMKRWIKHGGHYPVYHAVLFKQGFGVCEESLYDQHFVINGKVKKIVGDIEDIVTDSLSNFVQRHNKWSSLESLEQSLGINQISIKRNFFGNSLERRRYLKSLYLHLPLFIRPFMYFIYRYFIRLGFLDGFEGLIFHFLQGCWFRFLIDAKIFEIKKQIHKGKNSKFGTAIGLQEREL